MSILTKWYPQFLDHKANNAVLFPNTIPFLIPNIFLNLYYKF